MLYPPDKEMGNADYKEDYRNLIKEPFTQRLFNPVATKDFVDKTLLCCAVWGVKMCNFR